MRLFPYKAVPKIGNRVLSVVIAGPVIIGDDMFNIKGGSLW